MVNLFLALCFKCDFACDICLPLFSQISVIINLLLWSLYMRPETISDMFPHKCNHSIIPAVVESGIPFSSEPHSCKVFWFALAVLKQWYHLSHDSCINTLKIVQNPLCCSSCCITSLILPRGHMHKHSQTHKAKTILTNPSADNTATTE